MFSLLDPSTDLRVLRNGWWLAKRTQEAIKILFTIPPFVSEQWQMKQFWGTFTDEGFNVVMSRHDAEEEDDGEDDEESDDLDRLSHDWIAWTVILKNLAREYSNSSEENFTRYHADDFTHESKKKENVLTIGGPKSNDFTEEILDKCDEYRFGIQLDDYDGDRDIVSKDGRKTFEPNLDQDADERYDYGLITYCRNPYGDGDTEIIAISGSYGYGTKAAGELLTDRETLDELNDIDYDYFQAVCIVEVDGDSDPFQKEIVDFHPDLREESIVPLGDE